MSWSCFQYINNYVSTCQCDMVKNTKMCEKVKEKHNVGRTPTPFLLWNAWNLKPGSERLELNDALNNLTVSKSLESSSFGIYGGLCYSCISSVGTPSRPSSSYSCHGPPVKKKEYQETCQRFKIIDDIFLASKIII